MTKAGQGVERRDADVRILHEEVPLRLGGKHSGDEGPSRARFSSHAVWLATLRAPNFQARTITGLTPSIG